MESALAFSAVLIAQHPKLFLLIPAQSVWAKQPIAPMIAGFYRLFGRHCNPDEPVNILDGLDLRLNDPHPYCMLIRHADKLNDLSQLVIQ